MQKDNDFIADQFSLLARLMDIHGENSFRAKTYANAAFTIEKLKTPLISLSPEEIFQIKGIGESTGKKILEIIANGSMQSLTDLIANTPAGVLDMLHIKGLGPKKIATVWKTMGIESLGELLYACNENRLLLYKGFGEKTQQNVKEAIEFYLRNQGIYLYAEIEPFALTLQQNLQDRFPKEQWQLTGAFIQQFDTIDQLDMVTTLPMSELKAAFPSPEWKTLQETTTTLLIAGVDNIKIAFHCTTESAFTQCLFEHSGDEKFVQAVQTKMGADYQQTYTGEAALFEAAAIPYIIPACRRSEHLDLIAARQASLIQPNDIKGIIHTHSQWSDGIDTVEDMAKACIEQGYEYLVLSDHSKSAFYANGLNETRIAEQHQLIDSLNNSLAPFKIFKSIECDILNDGQLDYTNNILSTFDLVIASIHSNLKMSEEKAMQRLLTAIQNPYTTILGHPTGRLLLSRPGYPVQHDVLIDACAHYGVAIEINAHPRRLDIDWSWIPLAIEKGVHLSIDPDAHSIEGFKDCRYGVLAAQKGGLSAAQNLSSFSLDEFEAYLLKVKAHKTSLGLSF